LNLAKEVLTNNIKVENKLDKISSDEL